MPKEPIFNEVDPAEVNLSCFSDEERERTIRFIIRMKYGAVRPITPEELPGMTGYKPVNSSPSQDLLRLARVLIEAEQRANVRGLTPHVRRQRHIEYDALELDYRYLLNAEAGEENSEYSLALRQNGAVVAIASVKGSKRQR